MVRNRGIRVFSMVIILAILLSTGLLGVAASVAAPDVTGEWSITANTSRGSINIASQSGSEFSGTVSIDAGKTEALSNGYISGDTVTFTRTWPSGTLRQDFTGTLTVNSDGSASMSGTFSQNGSGSYKWSATKTTPMSLPSTPALTPSVSSGGLTPISGAVLNDQLSFKLNGETVVPVGDDGTPVLPISYNGTTYLPVRAMGYLLGLGIDWDGTTKTVLISSTTSAPGWYFTHWEYYKHPYDTADTGGIVGRFANGDTYTDYKEGKGEINNFINTTARQLSNGKIAYSGYAVTLWNDPPAYFSATDRPSITVNRTVESDWGISSFHIYLDEATINPGGASQGNIGFATPDGQRYVQTYQGTLQMEKALKGWVGAKKAIILYLNGHGFKYYYEWRE